MEMLKALVIDGKDMKVIKNLHWRQQEEVKVEGELLEYQISKEE